MEQVDLDLFPSASSTEVWQATRAVVPSRVLSRVSGISDVLYFVVATRIRDLIKDGPTEAEEVTVWDQPDPVTLRYLFP